MNIDFIGEEINSSRVLFGLVSKELYLHNLPIIFILGYSFLLKNYLTVAYVLLGLVLLNLEAEKYYTIRKEREDRKDNKSIALQDVITLQNYKPLVYYLILIYSTIEYIFKCTVFILFYVMPSQYDTLVNQLELANFGIYFGQDFGFINIGLSIFPNIAIVLVIGSMIAFRSNKTNNRIDKLEHVNQRSTLKYIMKPTIVLLIILLPIISPSLIGVVYITINFAFGLYWGITGNSKDLFYSYCKTIQMLSIFVVIVEYLISVGAIWKVSPDYSMIFIGLDHFSNFTIDIQSTCYIFSVFLLMVMTTLFVDVKKTHRMWDYYQKVAVDGSDIELQVEEIHLRGRVPLPDRITVLKDKESGSPVTSENKTKPKGEAQKSTRIHRLEKTGFFADLKKQFFEFAKNLVKQFASISFLVRALQLISIAVIYRYRTIFSIPLMIWLFASGLTNNFQIMTIYVGLPSSLFTFYSIYFANIPESPYITNLAPWLGALRFDSYWIEYTLTLIYLLLYTYFVRILKNKELNNDDEKKEAGSVSEEKKQTGKAKSRYVVAKAIIVFILKNVYYLALIVLYWIGMEAVSIFNMIIVSFFVTFFISPKYARKLWIYLLLFVSFALLLRYAWALSIYQCDSDDLSRAQIGEIVQFIGIVDYSDITCSVQGCRLMVTSILTFLIDQSTAINILYWFMFFFILLQYDIFRSSIFKASKQSVEELIEDVNTKKKYISIYQTYSELIVCLYYKSLVWVGYTVIGIILSIEDFDIQNMLQLLMLLFIIVFHLLKIRKHAPSSHYHMYALWNVFVVSNALITGLKYFFNFTRYQFINDVVLNGAKDSPTLSFITNNLDFLGFFKSKDGNLRTELLGEAIVLFFSVLMKSVLKLHRLFYKKSGETVVEKNQNETVNEKKQNGSKAKSDAVLNAVLLESLRKKRHRRELGEIYEKYLASEILNSWPKTKITLKVIGHIFWYFLYAYVVILSVFFRLSAGFLIMLTVYCYYLAKFNRSTMNYLFQNKIASKLQECLDMFYKWHMSQEKKKKRLSLSSQDNQEPKIFFHFTKTNLEYRLKIWKFGLILSAILYGLCYTTRMLSFDIFVNGGPFLQMIRQHSINITFVLGVYSNNNQFFQSNFPYFLLILFATIEIKLIQLLQKEQENETSKNTNTGSPVIITPRVDIKSVRGVEIELMPRNNDSHEVVNRNEISENKNSKKAVTFKQEKIGLDRTVKDLYTYSLEGMLDINKQSFEDKTRLIEYYKNSYIYLQIKFTEGLLNGIARLIIFVLLINADSKENLFAIFFYVAAILVWRIPRFDIKLLVKISDFTSFLAVVQYLLLVLNLNSYTSPVAIPPEVSFSSIFSWVFENKALFQNQYMDLLGFGKIISFFNKVHAWLGSKFRDTVSLLMDSIGVLILQIYLWVFMLQAGYVFKQFIKRTREATNSKDIQKNINLMKNYIAWKDRDYHNLKRVLNFVYLNLQTILITILSFLSLLHISLPNFSLTAVFLFYILLVEFTLVSAQVKMKIRFMKILFLCTQVALILIIGFIIVNKIPFEFFPLVDLQGFLVDKILIFTILQLLYDIIISEDYEKTLQKFLSKNSTKARLVSLCVTYKFNDEKLFKIIEDFMIKRKLNQKLQSISERLKMWHEQFFEDKNKKKDKTSENMSRIVDNDFSPRSHSLLKPNEEALSPNKKNFADLVRVESFQGKTLERLRSNFEQSPKIVLRKEKAEPFLRRFKAMIVRKLLQIRDPYLFNSVLKLYQEVAKKNKNIISTELFNFADYAIRNDFSQINVALDKLDRFYYNLDRMVQENPDKNLDELMEELEPNKQKSSPGASEEEGAIKANLPPRTDIGSENVERQFYDLLQNQDLEYQKYAFFDIILLMIEAILTYWEYFCYFNLMIYHITTNGLATLLIPLTIFGYALTEETRPKFKVWTLLFYFFIVVILLKFLKQYLTLGSLLVSQLENLLIVLLGSSDSFVFEGWLLVMLMTQMNLLKRSGFASASELTIENINQAFLRKKMNNDFGLMKKKLAEKEENDNQSFDATEYTRLDFDTVVKDIEKEFTQDLDKFTLDIQKSYFFRLFSIHNKKIGKDIYHWVALTQLIIALYIVIFYSAIESGSLTESITDSLRFNEFSGAMVVALFLQIGFVLIDRGIVLINSNKVKEAQQEEKVAYRQSGFKNFLIGSDLHLSKQRKFQKEFNKTFKEQINNESSESYEEEDDQSDHFNETRKGEDEDKEEGKRDKEFYKEFIFGLMKVPFDLLVKTQHLSQEPFHRYASFSKYILHIVLLFSFHLFIYWYLPLNQGDFCPLCSPASICFYILYSVYFVLSAYQLKLGIPEFKGRMVLMKAYSQTNKIAFKIYKAIPFFYEIKTFMDWTFTDTSLDLFQWLKFDEIYETLFVSKITSDSYFNTRIGQKVPKILKFMVGFCGILFLLLLILGPLLLFSTFNPFGTDNLVIGAGVSLGFEINKNYYPIFENSHVSNIKSITADEYNKYGFASEPVLRNVDYSRMQNVTMAPFSDSTWTIALPSYQAMIQTLEQVENDIVKYPIKTLMETTEIYFQMSFQFSQEEDLKVHIENNIQSTPNSITYSLLNSTDPKALLQTMGYLKNLLKCSGRPFKITQFYDSLIRLGTQQAPVSYPGNNNAFKKDVYLELVCQSQSQAENSASMFQIGFSYWRITIDNVNTGLLFYTITNRVSSFLIGFSVSAFYVGVVWLVGKTVRSSLGGQIQNLMLNDLPAALEIIQICEGILIARADKDLQKEELMYWELIDLLRSPEVLKIITQSSVETKLSNNKKLKED